MPHHEVEEESERQQIIFPWSFVLSMLKRVFPLTSFGALFPFNPLFGKHLEHKIELYFISFKY